MDILQSISRVMVDIVPQEQIQSARRICEVTSTYRDSEDLINIGAYQRGSNPDIDLAIEMNDSINAFLKQGIYEPQPYSESVQQVEALAKQCDQKRQQKIQQQQQKQQQQAQQQRQQTQQR